MHMVPAATGKDEFYSLWIHTKLNGEHRYELLSFLFHSGQHLVIGTSYDVVCIEIENQICPAPAFLCHGSGIRFLVVCR